MKIVHHCFRQLGSRAVRRHVRPQGIFGQDCLPAIVSSDLSTKVAFQSAFTAGTNTRHFSSGPKSVLLDMLAKEEKEERASGNMEMPKELKELKSSIEENWKIVEDGATTSLFRKNHSLKVQVSFHCQDADEDAPYDMDEYNEDNQEEEEEEEPSASVQFTVTVTKAGKSLVFACSSEYGSCTINGISTTTASAETVHDNQGVLAKKEYQGPDFLELEEGLQEQLHVYLEEECGVDSDVAAFIAMFSDYQEQACYISWLKETQSVLS
jgi:complement component 1 Q subcomponent-binding protein, mitochondrial